LTTSVRLIHRIDGGHATTYADAEEAFDFVIDKANRNPVETKPVLVFDDVTQNDRLHRDSVTGVYYHTGGRRAYPRYA